MLLSKKRSIIAILIILSVISVGLIGCGKVTNGTYTRQDGSSYKGQLKYGVPNGKGTMSFPGGNKYSGQFADGQMSGQGTFTWPNGDKYVGAFDNDLPNGKGTLWQKDNALESTVTAKDGKLTVVGTPLLHVQAQKKPKDSAGQTNTKTETK